MSGRALIGSHTAGRGRRISGSVPLRGALPPPAKGCCPAARSTPVSPCRAPVSLARPPAHPASRPHTTPTHRTPKRTAAQTNAGGAHRATRASAFAGVRIAFHFSSTSRSRRNLTPSADDGWDAYDGVADRRRASCNRQY
ncbi:hypothetical protein HYPSUDRAFT_204007 [Hypholoma sublateritium FD-334 SS-4]|uniref:Uncharacterized protein n=1 Tax=Hypholoma sublateritium (strain FD-334 SS-4) TaxID=945553 RepID=A0A0D2PJH3_HYPSF|nr:hypothetical protein HYPSUDRAFT_204007 [Hypholoma sublateritium FD-334 SS-4]